MSLSVGMYPRDSGKSEGAMQSVDIKRPDFVPCHPAGEISHLGSLVSKEIMRPIRLPLLTRGTDDSGREDP